MMHTRSSYPALLLGLALLAACGGGESDAAESSATPGEASTAAVNAASEENTQDLKDYDLSMGDVRKVEQAQLKLEELKRTRPEVQEKFDRIDEADDSNDDTFADVERKINQVPEMRAAIESSGMDVREYVVALSAMTYAGMADAMIAQGMNQDSIVRELQVNPKNVEFVRQNRAEVTRILQIGEDG